MACSALRATCIDTDASGNHTRIGNTVDTDDDGNATEINMMADPLVSAPFM